MNVAPLQFLLLVSGRLGQPAAGRDHRLPKGENRILAGAGPPSPAAVLPMTNGDPGRKARVLADAHWLVRPETIFRWYRS